MATMRIVRVSVVVGWLLGQVVAISAQPKLREADWKRRDDLRGTASVAVIPDGKHLCAVGSLSDKLARFKRDPATGKLEFIQSVPVGEKTSPGSAGIAFGADGKTCYVADEDAAAIWGFIHKAAK